MWVIGAHGTSKKKHNSFILLHANAVRVVSKNCTKILCAAPLARIFEREERFDVLQTHDENQIGLLPISSLTGRTSPSAEAAKARQIRSELSLTGEQRVELALNLGRRQYRP